MDVWSLLLVFIVAALQCFPTWAQTINVQPIPGVGGKKGRWYIWLVVALAGVMFIVTVFFVVRGCRVHHLRKKREALQAEHRARDIEFGAVPSGYDGDTAKPAPVEQSKDSTDPKAGVLPKSVPPSDAPVPPPLHDFTGQLSAADLEDRNRRVGLHGQGSRNLNRAVSNL
ncbi:hypothetical protein WJX72_009767 [[Myrmecia] bisecta]|uniref:Uncharacterized protein n=1 Tax=[Myrmecia] bisecta TaxID=41462 RepID=A0AAW1R922_9CHLO